MRLCGADVLKLFFKNNQFQFLKGFGVANTIRQRDSSTKGLIVIPYATYSGELNILVNPSHFQSEGNKIISEIMEIVSKEYWSMPCAFTDTPDKGTLTPRVDHKIYTIIFNDNILDYGIDSAFGGMQRITIFYKITNKY